MIERMNESFPVKLSDELKTCKFTASLIRTLNYYFQNRLLFNTIGTGH